MRPHRATTDGGDREFARALSDLRRGGASLLVVGGVPEDVHGRACSTLLGTDDETRRRVFGLAGRDTAAVERRLPAGAPRDHDHLRVVATNSVLRGGADAREADTSGPGPDGPEVGGGPAAVDGRPAPGGASGDGRGVDAPSGGGHREVPDDPDAFLEALVGAVGGVAGAASTPSAGEVRVCVDSLAHLFEEHDRGEVVTFCHAATTRIAEVDGLAHFHLPVDPEEGIAKALEPVFDVVVELRVGAGGPEQRWRIREGADSGWIPVGLQF